MPLSDSEKNILQEYLHNGKNTAGQPLGDYEYKQYFKSRQADLHDKLGFLIVEPSSPGSGNSLEIIYQDASENIHHLKCDYLMRDGNTCFVQDNETQGLIEAGYQITQIDEKAIEIIKNFMMELGRKVVGEPCVLLNLEKAPTVQQTTSGGMASPVVSEVKDTAVVTASPRSCVVFDRKKWVTKQNGYHLIEEGGKYVIRTSSQGGEGSLTVDYCLPGKKPNSIKLVLKDTGWEQVPIGSASSPTPMNKDDANQHISSLFTLIEKIPILQGLQRIDPGVAHAVDPDHQYGDYKPLINIAVLSIQSLDHEKVALAPTNVKKHYKANKDKLLNLKNAVGIELQFF